MIRYNYNHVIECITHNTGTYLSLKGRIYANNSVISITEIGETDHNSTSPTPNDALQCISDRIPCCRYRYRIGEWYFPDRIRVQPLIYYHNGSKSFYRSRGRDDGTVNLNRASTNIITPTGLFCCKLPNATDVITTLCANIGECFHFAIIIIAHNAISDVQLSICLSKLNIVSYVLCNHVVCEY